MLVDKAQIKDRLKDVAGRAQILGLQRRACVCVTVGSPDQFSFIGPVQLNALCKLL